MAPVSGLISITLERMVLMTRCSLSSSCFTPKRVAVFCCSRLGSPSEKARRKEKSSTLGFWRSSGNLVLGHSV